MIRSFFIFPFYPYRIRGALASLVTLNFNLGVVFGYITGTYLEWFSRCIVLMVFPFIFFVLFCFIPESPQYFLKNGQTEVGIVVCWAFLFNFNFFLLLFPAECRKIAEILQKLQSWFARRNETAKGIGQIKRNCRTE